MYSLARYKLSSNRLESMQLKSKGSRVMMMLTIARRESTPCSRDAVMFLFSRRVELSSPTFFTSSPKETVRQKVTIGAALRAARERSAASSRAFALTSHDVALGHAKWGVSTNDEFVESRKRHGTSGEGLLEGERGGGDAGARRRAPGGGGRERSRGCAYECEATMKRTRGNARVNT